MTSYQYPGYIDHVIDGDSVEIVLDLGFNLSLNMNVRINGINARELHMPGGKEARDHLASLLPPVTPVNVISLGWDKYGGRIDGIIVIPQGIVAAILVSEHWAAEWNGKGTAPLPPWPRPEETE